MGVLDSTYLGQLDGDVTATATDVYDSPFEVSPRVIVAKFDKVVSHCVRVSLVVDLGLSDPQGKEGVNKLFRHPAIAWAKRPEFSGYSL